MPERTCPTCGSTITSTRRTYCNPTCKYNARRTRDLASRQPATCQRCGNPTPPGHTRWCSTTCRRGTGTKTRPQRRTAPCPVCERPWPTRGGQRTCSADCGTILRAYEAGRTLATQYASIIPWDRLAPRTPWAPPHPCADCGQPIPCTTRSTRCTSCHAQRSEAARNLAHARRRAGDPTMHGDPITRSALGERDNWTCHVCNLPVDQDPERFGQPRPLAATIDHLIELAAGGTHTWDNVALAHRACNIERSVHRSKQPRAVAA